MKRLFIRFKTKPTVFLIGGAAVILYSISAIFYYISKNGGESMYALLYIFLIAFAFIAMIVDVGLTNAINFKIVSILECLIIGAIYLIVEYNTKTATIDITSIKKPYMIIVDDPNGIGLDKFQSSGLFDKTYVTTDTDIVRINKTSLNRYELKFKDPKSWEQSELYFLFYKPEYVFDCDFITSANLDIKFSEKQIDSLLTAKFLKKSKIIIR